MKSLTLLPLCLLLSLPCIPSAAALPPDIEDLIQADKYAEALARIEVLLKAKPEDTELQQTRKELQAELSKSGAAPAVNSSPAPAANAAPYGDTGPNAVADSQSEAAPRATLSPLDAKELELIMNDLNRAVGDARQPLLKELSARTGELVGTYPDAINLWAMRALAVYELNDADAAKQAGANLLRLGAERSTNDQMISLLATLKRKGWLMTQDGYEKDKVLVAKQAQEEMEKEAADAAAKKKARAAKIAELRRQYRNCMAQVDYWDEVTSKDRHLRNPTYEQLSVDKSYEWGIKAAQIVGELGKLGVSNKELQELLKWP